MKTLALSAALLAVGCAGTVRPPAHLLPTPPSSCGINPRYQDLAAILEPIRQKYNLPALGAAVVTPDGVVALGVVGVRKYGDTTRACVDDSFHLGSDSKAMTAVVIAKLVEQGKLTWTTTIHDLLSDIADQDPAYAAVTVEQLLAHRSGLRHDPGFSNNGMRFFRGSLREQRETYARIALHEPPEHPPGTTFSYSNTGYVLAGLMAERASGRAWEELVRDTLFVPLQMSGAGFGPTSSPGRVDGLWAHKSKNGVPVPVESGPEADNPLLIAPAGSVHVALEGWASFISDVLRGFEGNGAVLSKDSYQHLHVPTFGGNYAYGWGTAERALADGTAYMHAGSNTVNFAVAWVAPKRRFAVLVATNLGTPDAAHACDEAASALIRRQPR